MAGDGGVSLADVARPGEDAAKRLHLAVRQAVDALQVPEQRFVLIVQRLVLRQADRTAESGEQSARRDSATVFMAAPP